MTRLVLSVFKEAVCLAFQLNATHSDHDPSQLSDHPQTVKSLFKVCADFVKRYSKASRPPALSALNAAHDMVKKKPGNDHFPRERMKRHKAAASAVDVGDNATEENAGLANAGEESVPEAKDTHTMDTKDNENAVEAATRDEGNEVES